MDTEAILATNLLPLIIYCGAILTITAVMLGGAYFLRQIQRGALPRPRYDQLMTLGWKVLLPAGLSNLLVTGAVVLSLHG